MLPQLASADVWGDIPTWVSAVATLIALVFAAIAAFAAHRVYRIESGRDKLALEERRKQADFQRRAQAALVSAWWGCQNDPVGEGYRWGALVRNASETPVYQNRVWVINLNQPDHSDSFTLDVMPPTSEPKFYASDAMRLEHDNDLATLEIRVEMTFTDSGGIRWIRDRHGQLSEVLPGLTILADDQRAAALELLSREFLLNHGVSVSLSCPRIEVMQNEFLAAVAVGNAPDIMSAPHDWIGTLADRGLIEPLVISEERRLTFVPRLLEAMTYQGKVYGLPFAADSVALLRNLDLSPAVPASIEELLDSGNSLCLAGRADEAVALQVGNGSGFYIYPLFTSLGGNLFARTADGMWDQDAIAGIASRRAFERFAELGEQGERVLRREITRDRAFQLFVEGRTPYLVGAPRELGAARDAGLRVAVSRIPPFLNAAPARSAASVQGFFLPSAGRNKIIARDLVLDYLTRMDVAEALYRNQPRYPALVAAVDTFYARDPQAAVYRDQFDSCDLIPSTASVMGIWTIFHKAQTDAIAGVEIDSVMREFSRGVESLNGR